MTAANDMPPDRDDEAALWCVSLAEGVLSEEERDAFDAWIADPVNARAFEEAAQVWNGADAAAEVPELIQMRSAALESFRRANERRWIKPFSRSWYWAGGIAAMFLVAVISAAMLHTPTQTFETGVAERRIAMLDEGSKLSLDADTEVTAQLSKDRRALTLLRGRVKFDVARDPLRPFTVTAGDKIVVATGTSFSVEVLDRQVHVLLYDGHVAVLDQRSNKAVTRLPTKAASDPVADHLLTPGRELIARLGANLPARVFPADLARSASWESGQLSFDDEPLPSAVARMNRYSTEKLAVGNARAAQIRVNGVFIAGDNAAFIEGLTALNPVIVEREPGKLTLKSN